MRRYFITILVVALGLAFAVVCLAVRLRRGNARWIRRKLVIGGLLLALTGLAAGCKDSTRPEVLCYDTAVSSKPAATTNTMAADGNRH